MFIYLFFYFLYISVKWVQTGPKSNNFMNLIQNTSLGRKKRTYNFNKGKSYPTMSDYGSSFRIL